MPIKEILTVGSDGQATAGGSGLNEQPLKNYMKTYANANSALTIAGTIITATGNLVSLTAAHVSNLGTTITSSPSTTLRGTNNYLTAMADTDTSGAAFFQLPAFTLDGSDYGKPISISFDVTGVTADGNWDVVIARYNSAGVYGSLISVAGNASPATPASAKLPTGTTTFNGFFVPDSTTPTDLYAIRLRHRVSNAAIRIDTLFIGPQPIRVGAAITDPVEYTPTIDGLGSVSFSDKIHWARSGQFIDVWGRFTSGTTTAAEARIYLPTGLTTGSTSSNNQYAGRWVRNTATGAQVKGGPLLSYSGYNYVTFSYDDTTTAAAPFSTQLGNNIISSSQVVSFAFRVPISQWSSNVTMADRAVESYAADDGSSDVFGPNGALVPNIATSTGATSRDFVFPETKQATDSYVLEYNVSGNGWSVHNGVFNFIEGQNSYIFGVRGFWISATTYRVQFGNGGIIPNNGLGAASTTAWSAQYSNGDRFRVRRVSAGAQVGYPISPNNLVKSVVHYKTGVAQSIPNVTATIVDFATKGFDTKGEVTTGASWKFTAQQTGYYRANAAFLLDLGGGWAINEAIEISVFKNGTVFATTTKVSHLTQSSYMWGDINTIVQLNAGEYIDIRIYQNSGAAVTLLANSTYNFVDIEQIA